MKKNKRNGKYKIYSTMLFFKNIAQYYNIVQCNNYYCNKL